MFWSMLQELGLQYLCKIELFKASTHDPEALRVVGANAHDASVYIQQFVSMPPEDFVSAVAAALPNRVLCLIEDKIAREGPSCFTDGNDTWVSVVRPTKVFVRAIRSAEDPNRANIETDSVMSKIRFWVRQGKYDQFVDCMACGDPYNPDEGISCRKGHFFCCVQAPAASGTDGTCFVTMLEGQLSSLKARSAHRPQCPVCHEPYDTTVIASRVAQETWSKLEEAIVDAKVESRAAKLQREFDDRLHAKMQELIANHGDTLTLVKSLAEETAKKIRSEVLNLACPHCKMPYAEFEGCMALQCATCKNFFCACCHKKAVNREATHDHVRECDLNPTSNGSYHATPEQVQSAQMRYRIKSLKSYLRNVKGFTKAHQNATVIELKKDLIDLGIDPGALIYLDE
jgi:hypothetical protein